MKKIFAIVALCILCILMTGCRQISQNKADLNVKLKDLPPTVTALTITQNITNTNSAQTGVQTKAVPFDLFRGASAAVGGTSAENVAAPVDGTVNQSKPLVPYVTGEEIPAEPFPPSPDVGDITP